MLYIHIFLACTISYFCVYYVFCVVCVFSFVDFPSVLWYCWLGLLTCKNRLPYNLYRVGGDIKHYTIQCSRTLQCLPCHIHRGATLKIGQSRLKAGTPICPAQKYGSYNIPALKLIGKGFYRKWVKSSFEQFITTQTRVGSANGWIISQNAEILKFYFWTISGNFRNLQRHHMAKFRRRWP